VGIFLTLYSRLKPLTTQKISLSSLETTRVLMLDQLKIRVSSTLLGSFLIVPIVDIFSHWVLNHTYRKDPYKWKSV
jgi:glucose-6-phosphate-specific signal transduction histidine kinase